MNKESKIDLSKRIQQFTTGKHPDVNCLNRAEYIMYKFQDIYFYRYIVSVFDDIHIYAIEAM